MANRLTENKNRDASFPASEKAFEDVEYEKSEEDRQQQVGQRGTKHRRHLLFLKRFLSFNTQRDSQYSVNHAHYSGHSFAFAVRRWLEGQD